MDTLKKSLTIKLTERKARLLGLDTTSKPKVVSTGGVNIQQLPKREGYLSCLIPRKGFAMLQMDVNSLEPTVIAELSRDAGYISVYGSGRADCIYLFIGSKIPQFADKIRKYYDPKNPTPEGIALAKKHCYHERSICKVFHLGAGYGAGAPTLYAQMIMHGIDITLAEVYELRKMYWRVFAQVVAYQERLTREWENNGGWFRDGLGCRVAVDSDKQKDMLNRCIQNTGHKILVKWLHIFNRLRLSSKVEAYPLVCDFHDETVWEVKYDHKEEAIKLMQQTWVLLNEELGGEFKLAGEPEIVSSFADFKCKD